MNFKWQAKGLSGSIHDRLLDKRLKKREGGRGLEFQNRSSKEAENPLPNLRHRGTRETPKGVDGRRRAGKNKKY